MMMMMIIHHGVGLDIVRALRRRRSLDLISIELNL